MLFVKIKLAEYCFSKNKYSNIQYLNKWILTIIIRKK